MNVQKLVTFGTYQGLLVCLIELFSAGQECRICQIIDNPDLGPRLTDLTSDQLTEIFDGCNTWQDVGRYLRDRGRGSDWSTPTPVSSVALWLSTLRSDQPRTLAETLKIYG